MLMEQFAFHPIVPRRFVGIGWWLELVLEATGIRK